MLNRLLRSFRRSMPPSLLVIGPPPTLVVGPPQRTPIVVGPGTRLVVQPPRRGAWDEKGWVLEGGHLPIYRGYFQVRENRTGRPQRFSGRIEVAPNELIPYISNPPADIRRHPKGPCFMHIDGDWFRIHWHRPARNVDDTILYIERILDEVINNRRIS